MKLSCKYSFVVAILAGLFISSNASASISASQISQLLQKQILSYLPKELAGLIDPSGNIDVERTLRTISKQGADAAIEQILKNGSVAKTAGQESDTLIRDEIEVAQSANSKSNQDSLDDFKANAPMVDRVATDNSTPSESSLEAADKANNLSSAQLSSTQRLNKSTNDLTTAVQIANTNAIRQAQLDRVKQVRERVDIAADRQDVAHTKAMLMNRYYPDGAGELTKVDDNSGVAAFGGN